MHWRLEVLARSPSGQVDQHAVISPRIFPIRELHEIGAPRRLAGSWLTTRWISGDARSAPEFESYRDFTVTLESGTLESAFYLALSPFAE